MKIELRKFLETRTSTIEETANVIKKKTIVPREIIFIARSNISCLRYYVPRARFVENVRKDNCYNRLVCTSTTRVASW